MHTFRLFLAALTVAAIFSTGLSAQTVVNPSSSVEWDNVAGAVSYEVKLSFGAIDKAVADPATDDPDGDKIVEIAEDISGVTSIPLSVWIPVLSLGDYTVSVRSVDSNGNTGPWGTLLISYSPPPAPFPRVASLLLFPANYADLSYQTQLA